MINTSRIGYIALILSIITVGYMIVMEKSEEGIRAKEIAFFITDFTLFFGGIGLIMWSRSASQRKRVLMILVPLCSVLVIAGIASKTIGILGASIELLLGTFMFAFIVSPIVARNRYENWHEHTKSKPKLLAIMLTDSLGFALVGLGLVFWIQRWPSAQILVMSGLLFLVAASILWNGSIDTLFKIQLSMRKEVESQRDEIHQQHEQLEEKNKEITDSIVYAKRIQEAILPPLKLVKEHLEESFILYKPKDIVAGDFYWMESVDDTVIFAAADCTGHGVPGAMVSVVCSNALNRSVREFGLTEPAKILDKTLEIVIERFEKSEEEVKDGMDIALCALNTKTKELQYAGANNPLWIVSEKAQLADGNEAKGQEPDANGLFLHETKATKQPIGKYSDPKPYENHSFKLHEGDSIYVFSDGYPDQFGGEKGKKLKTRAFKELLLSIQDQPMDAQRKVIDDYFETWRGENEQIDDVCVIGVRI
ncbi:MAG: hypothetical protein Salg2KO_09520 [Salibacteraceae bacterium]